LEAVEDFYQQGCKTNRQTRDVRASKSSRKKLVKENNTYLSFKKTLFPQQPC
jgi:hypothetical protein